MNRETATAPAPIQSPGTVAAAWRVFWKCTLGAAVVCSLLLAARFLLGDPLDGAGMMALAIAVAIVYGSIAGIWLGMIATALFVSWRLLGRRLIAVLAGAVGGAGLGLVVTFAAYSLLDLQGPGGVHGGGQAVGFVLVGLALVMAGLGAMFGAIVAALISVLVRPRRLGQQS
jgi:hypothetical protein